VQKGVTPEAPRRPLRLGEQRTIVVGQLVDGVWREGWYDTSRTGGRFVRAQASFRREITARGGQYPAQVGRYHLYVNAACPWAHHTLIVRALKALQDHLTVSTVHYVEDGQGWAFDASDDRRPAVDAEANYLHETYVRSDATFTGQVTVPVLLDKGSGQIVSNESSEIIRMMYYSFDDLGAKPGD
jgi:glutathionyl-hydroquinone reductase